MNNTNQNEKLFCDFLLEMSCDMNNDRIKRYLSTLEGFSEECIKNVFDQWMRINTFKFPSENELLDLLIKQDKRICGPQTIKDLFGNKIRVCTPLSNEFRKIFKYLVTGAITKEQAYEMVKDAEEKYGYVSDPSIPIRKTPEQCIFDSGVNEYKIKQAFGKIHKGEDDKQEINKLAECLLPFGHFLFRVKDNNLEFISLDNDTWRESFQVLVEYGK